MKRTLIVLLICFLAMVIIDAKPVHAASYNLLVSAWGGTDSVGNSGVGAEIRTHSYTVPSSDENHVFWVGDNLVDGGFVQFGYALLKDRFCLSAEMLGGVFRCKGFYETIANGDVRWFWEFWPNSNDYYYSVGPYNSAGPDGAWHTYQVLPNAAGRWSFVLDGQTVTNMNTLQATISKDPVYVTAEEVTDTYPSGGLGPVEFRNLTYYNQNWIQVKSLTASTYCSKALTASTYCSNVPYGVTVLGPNHIAIGKGQTLREKNELLWGNQLSITMPSGVQVAVDGKSYTSPLTYTSPGLHSLSVPSIVPKDDSTRLRFDHWSDGSTLTNRTINLQGDTKLTAIYNTQYRLSLGFPAASQDWYDSGSTATFSAPSRFLVWRFQGWYESGTLVSASNNDSIRMDAPHILTVRWTPDYLLIGIICIITFVVLSMLYYRKRTSSADKPKPELHTQETVPEVVSIKKTEPNMTALCIQCGANIPRDSKFCKECGSKLGRVDGTL